MKTIYNWWNGLSTNTRRIFDIGVLCAPFHIGMGLTFWYKNPSIMLAMVVLPVFFVFLNWKYSR